MSLHAAAAPCPLAMHNSWVSQHCPCSALCRMGAIEYVEGCNKERLNCLIEHAALHVRSSAVDYLKIQKPQKLTGTDVVPLHQPCQLL
jgi:hypothetical protein